MQDNFKDLVENNREEFDFPFDVDKGWQSFEKTNFTNKQSKRIWLVAAASVTLLLGFFAIRFAFQDEPQELSEWDEVEMFYQSQIEDMTTLVKNHGDDEILYDLEEMDQAFLEIKEDLNDDAANAEVIEAMMNHYRLKLEILEKMLDEIQEEDEKDKDTTIL